MYNLVDLTGKKIIVTGASSGIGRETAIVLSKLGAQVILLARRRNELESTLGMLESDNGHCFYECDLSDLETIEKLIKTIVSEVGPLDGMAYCAGFTRDYPMKFMKPEVVESVMKTNFEAFVEIVRCLAIKKNYNRGMRIVGISSVAAMHGAKAHLAYAASKAAMDGAVRCMAYELADKGICVNTVAPAMIATKMYQDTLDALADPDVYNEALLGRQYLGIGEPVDVANSIAFLLSSAAKFITGICMPIDGGFTSI